MPSILHTSLRERTRVHHSALEKTFIKHIRRINTLDEYACFLSLLHAYHQAVETAAFEHLGDLESDFIARRRSNYLADDVLELTGNLPQHEGCKVSPQLTSLPAALGAFYVLEGSTMGGEIIARMISQKLNNSGGLAFFKGYGDRTMAMWEQFKKHLELTFTELEQEEIVEAASDTFVTFNLWLQRHE